jgi:hypothetical protein
MAKKLYISAACAGLFTWVYLQWLTHLSSPMPTASSWFFGAVFLIGMVFGMKSHQPGYEYLIPITFSLAFLFCMAAALLLGRVFRQR